MGTEWKTPKTNWRADDFFDIDPDWHRICGNILFLQRLARPVYGEAYLPQIPAPSADDLPFAETLQAVEDAAEAIRLKIPLASGCPAKRNICENEPFWSFEDLNRIEENTAKFLQMIARAKENRPRLAFTLGGGAFAT